MTNTADELTAPDQSPVIVAGPGQWYRIKFSIVAAVMIAMGGWFGYDGFVGWPRMNDQLRQLKAQKEEADHHGDSKRSQAILEQMNRLNHGAARTASEITLQKILFFVLPPVGLYLVIRALYNSRGEYRLSGDMLQMPGHPPVPLENITELDRRLWERKGIAYLSYDLGEGLQGALRLDDYYHDRAPTDEIFKRVEQYLTEGKN